MKKLLFVFVSIFTLVLSGCGTQNESTNGFGNNSGTPENSENTEGGSTEESTDENSEENKKENSNETGASKESEKSNVNQADKTALKITSFDGSTLETEQTYNVVRGSTPKSTYSVTVNGYKLQKYYPGQTAWSYIAGEKYKTLKVGNNNYIVKALDKSGKEIASTNFNINYTALKEHKLPNVGSNGWVSLMLTLSIMGTYFIARQKKILRTK